MRTLLIAVATLAVLLFLASQIGGETAIDATSGQPTVEQVSWSINVGGEGTITLKGDLPDGYPTETWVDGELVDRHMAGDFSWDLASGLPAPVFHIVSLETCEQVQAEVDLWSSLSDSAEAADMILRHLAFAQAAMEHGRSLGCE